MTLTLLQGQSCVRKVNCKLRVLDSCPLQFKHCMVDTYNTKNYAQCDLCNSGVYSREMISMCFVGEVLGLSTPITLGFTQTLSE